MEGIYLLQKTLEILHALESLVKGSLTPLRRLWPISRFSGCSKTHCKTLGISVNWNEDKFCELLQELYTLVIVKLMGVVLLTNQEGGLPGQT